MTYAVAEVAGLNAIGNTSVVVLDSFDALAAHADALNDLSGDVCVPNIAYEPWLAVPLARACADRQRFAFMLIFDHDGTLIGFFPFERAPFHPLLPLSCLRLWADAFRYVAPRDPLVRNGAADLCIDALLDWLRRHDSSPGLLDLRSLTNAEIVRAVERRLAADALNHFHMTQVSHLYRRHDSADAYLNAVISSRGQQSLRAKVRKLQKLGAIEYEDVARAPGMDVSKVDRAIDAFLDLEARSWKGREGVSVDSHGHRGVFKDILREAHRRGRLSLLTLRVGGELAAARCVFLKPPGSFLLKLSYDERFAKQSPGLLLEAEAIRRLHRNDEPLGNRIAWMDTCASANSPIFNRTRSESLTVHRYAIAAPRTAASLVVGLWPLARAAAGLARASGTSSPARHPRPMAAGQRAAGPRA